MATKKVSFEIDEILPYFDALEEPRSTLGQLHPLVSVVVISLMAVLAGAGGPEGDSLTDTYVRRWGVETFFRAYKQTLGRRKLISCTPELALVECRWSVVAVRLVCLAQ